MDLSTVFTTAAIGLIPASLTSLVAYQASVRSTRATQQASHRAVQATHAKLHHEIAVELLKSTHEDNRAGDRDVARGSYTRHDIAVRTLPLGELRMAAEAVLDAAYAFASQESSTEVIFSHPFLNALNDFNWLVDDVLESYRPDFQDAQRKLRIFYSQQDTGQDPPSDPVADAFTAAGTRSSDMDLLLHIAPEERRRALAEVKEIERRREATVRTLDEARRELEKAAANLTTLSPLALTTAPSRLTLRGRPRRQ